MSKMVKVEWLDSVGRTGWRNRQVILDDSPYEDLLHESVGFLVHEDEHSITLTHSRSAAKSALDSVDDVIRIPKVAITKRREVR